jgi:hypothetical protein
MTSPLNLPAPGRRQTLYILYTSLQSPVFLVNSRHPLFTATQGSFGSKSLHLPEHTFSRSYGVILPSSLTRVLSRAFLGFSPRPPESVCGTVTRSIHYEAFLGSVGSASLFPIRGSPSRLGVMTPRICLWDPPTRLDRDIRHPDGLPFSVPSSLKHPSGGTGILTCFPSTTPFGLALGTD